MHVVAGCLNASLLPSDGLDCDVGVFGFRIANLKHRGTILDNILHHLSFFLLFYFSTSPNEFFFILFLKKYSNSLFGFFPILYPILLY